MEESEAVELCIRFFNTYIRHGLNFRNVRAIYNVLYEYKRFAVSLLESNPNSITPIVEHLVYYGRLANNMGLPFVTVTVAHDVRSICQESYLVGSGDHRSILERFLMLDQQSEVHSEEVALVGVRKAQSILGAFFLLHSAKEEADLIRHDMEDESSKRLVAIRDEILAVRQQKFWEITDRGINFDFVEQEMRPLIEAFFDPLISDHARE